MEQRLYDYAVIGGDMRQLYLTRELSRSFRTCCYGLCDSSFLKSCYSNIPIYHGMSWEDTLINSNAVIGPIPLSKNGRHLNQESPVPVLTLSQLGDTLCPGQHFFAGCIPQKVQDTLTQKGILVHDLMEDEALTIYNSIATAEGAISEAICKSAVNLRLSNCALLGYGVCGHTLADYLRGMLCSVCIYTDNPRKYAQAAVTAHEAKHLDELSGNLGTYDFIFNTIPALVLDRELLYKVKPTVTIIDIASAPGGIDYCAAGELEINASLCPGLPGRYAPYSSARAIQDGILRHYNT